jgi:methylated-DNA-[protein]-cysteine S-methyltransferase
MAASQDDRLTRLHGMTMWSVFNSPLGPLTMVGDAGRLTELRFPGRPAQPPAGSRDDDAFAEVTRQLGEYFAEARTVFDLSLELHGSEQSRLVWTELRTIPYGETISYSALARAVGRPDEVREVAATVGRTPVPIVIPCHRVVAVDGALTGYGGGLDRKRALLDLEAPQLTLV